MLKAIIFDLDGVLVHTDHLNYQSWKALADRLSIPFDETVNDRMRGVSRQDSLDILLEQSPRAYSQEEKRALAAEKNDAYRARIAAITPADLSFEVRETLETLRTRGFLLAVGSSSKNCPLILERIGLGNFFDAVADGNHITRSKPDPEVFFRAAEYLGIQPEQALVVEDAEAGILAAHAGGFPSAAIGPARQSPLAGYRLERFSALLCIPALCGAE